MLSYLPHPNFTSSMLGHPMIFPMLGHLRICPISVHLWICLIFVHLRIFPTELLFPPALALFLSFPPTTTIPSIRTTWTYFCWTFLSIFFLQHFLKKKNLTHLLILFHQMISSLSCTEEERYISIEYQGCWGYIIYDIYDILKDLEISSSPFLRIAGPWPSSCFRRLHLKIRWSDDDDVDESDV